MLGITAAFATLEDPRRPNARHHQLLDILVIAFCASLCGAESCVDMADFAEAKEDVLREFLPLEGGPPSHDTFSRVFRMLDPTQFAACFQAYLDQWGAACRGHVALAGKTLRGAHDRAAGVSPLQMVSAFASETRLTLGQIAVEAHSNEIPAVRVLLSLLSLEGCTVTLDALHTQRETAQAVLDQGASYVLALKGNQGTWCEDVHMLPRTPTCRFMTGRRRSTPIMAASKPERPISLRISFGCRSSITGRAWPVSANSRPRAKRKRRALCKPRTATIG